MSHPTMMLVDDDSCLLAGLTDMLQFRLPHVRVAPFESPCAALARFKTTVPVIMMSGHAERAVVIDAMGMGAFDVLRKPFDRDEFVTAVTYALAAHKLSRDVKARQLHSHRITQRIAVLDALIQASQEKPITIPSIKQRIQTSRQLNQSSVVLMKRSLDMIQQQTILLEARLKETERPLLTAWQEAHRRAIYRFTDQAFPA
jgi:DNA-binding response OmpR family regulator